MDELLDHLKSEVGIGVTHCFRQRAQLVGLYRNPDRNYCIVESGAATVMATSANGESFLLSVLGPGTIISPHAAQWIQHGQLSITGKALTPMVVRHLSLAEWNALATRLPMIELFVTRQASELLSVVQYQLALHCRRNSLQRTRIALWVYAISVGDESSCGGLRIKLSRDDLTHCVNVSADRIVRLLGQLSASGEITIQGRIIIISKCMIDTLSCHLPLRRDSNLSPVAI